MGVNAAMAGWHHPYCRVLGDQLVDCLALPSFHSTAALADEARASRDGVWKTVPWLFQRQFMNLRDMFSLGDEPGAGRLRDEEIQSGQQQQYFQIRDRAYRDAADPRIDLVLVHVPSPHLLPIYNRREGNFHLDGRQDYFDNVALVDRTLGELRRAIEKAGLSDRTSLLITADHGLRPEAWVGRIGWTEELDRLTERQPPETVPFILKLAGQKQPVRVEHAAFHSIFGEAVEDYASVVLRAADGMLGLIEAGYTHPDAGGSYELRVNAQHAALVDSGAQLIAVPDRALDPAAYVPSNQRYSRFVADTLACLAAARSPAASLAEYSCFGNSLRRSRSRRRRSSCR
jgi:hypothetical protein